MATVVSFVDMAQLTVLLKKTAGSLDNDPYTLLVIAVAEEKVRSTAGQDGWVGEDPGPNQSLAPARARFIGLWLAKRAWEEAVNQQRLQRRTAGPISETFFDETLSGLSLSDDDLLWLKRQGGSTGLWVQPIGTKATKQDIYILNSPYPFSSPILFDNGSMGWAYGEPTV